MGEVYAPEADSKDTDRPTFTEDIKELGTSFVGAVRQSVSNVFSTFGIATMSADESADETAERSSLRVALRHHFTPLSAYAFITFVLLYMPCVVTAVAMVQEFGTLKWYGITFAYQMLLAWGVAALIYQGGRLLGIGG